MKQLFWLILCLLLFSISSDAAILGGGGGGAGSGGTEFTEDAVSAGDESGPAVLGVRRDADTSPVTATGDFHTLIFDDLGNLKVNVKSSVDPVVTNKSVNISQLGGSIPGVTNPFPIRVSDGTVFVDPVIACDSSALLNMTTATTTEIVALVAGKSIHVCSFSIVTSDASNVKFIEGTGANCVTGPSDLTSNMPFQTGGTGIARGSGIGSLFINTAGEALCVTSSAAVTVAIDVSYTQF